MRVRSSQRIRQVVRRILAERKIVAPPIPVETIAKSFEVELRSEYFDGDLSGILYRDPQKTVIGINRRHHRKRQRFTIAHELGHFMFHYGRSVFIDKTFAARVNLRDEVSSRAEDLEEIEANRFAAELLMPYDMLISDLDSQTVDVEQENDEGLRFLCRRYDVSGQAMRFRIMNLAVSPFSHSA